jgi:hypothetical protein
VNTFLVASGIAFWLLVAPSVAIVTTAVVRAYFGEDKP